MPPGALRRLDVGSFREDRQQRVRGFEHPGRVDVVTARARAASRRPTSDAVRRGVRFREASKNRCASLGRFKFSKISPTHS